MERGPTSSFRYDVRTSPFINGEQTPVVRRRSAISGAMSGRASRSLPETGDAAHESSRLKIEWPTTIVGYPAEQAVLALPFLPDQEREVTVWLLLMAWIGQSYPDLTPKGTVRSVLGFVADVRSTGWVPGKRLKLADRAPQELAPIIRLINEFGGFQVMSALIGCCCVYILLNVHILGQGFDALLKEVTAAAQEFDQWADTCS